MATKFGFEQEFFVRNAAGEVLFDAPYALPLDGGGHLVEARSGPFNDPAAVKASLEIDVVRVSSLAKVANVSLACIPQFDYGKRIKYGAANKTIERAGFHVHFSTDNPQPLDRDAIIAAFNKHFKQLLEETGRLEDPPSGAVYRMKSYGWEYRLLPTTVDVDELVDFLKGLKL